MSKSILTKIADKLFKYSSYNKPYLEKPNLEIKHTYYSTVPLRVNYRVPFGDREIPQSIIKRYLLNMLAQEIGKYVEISTQEDCMRGGDIIYTADLKILKESDK